MKTQRKARTHMTDEFAQRLAGLRRERGYSQEALAAKLGLSRQAVSKWERAESQPDTTNLIALADLYGITLDELIRNGCDEADPSHEDEAAHGEACEQRIEAAPEMPDLALQPASEAAAREPEAPCPPLPPQPVAPQRFRNPWMTFPYPILVVIVYLAIGFAFRWWHPGWVLFLTIPFYYWAAIVIGKDPSFRAAHTIESEG